MPLTAEDRSVLQNMDPSTLQLWNQATVLARHTILALDEMPLTHDQIAVVMAGTTQSTALAFAALVQLRIHKETRP